MNTKVKILVLAANPVNTSQLRLGEEVRSIEAVLKQSKYRDHFELISQWAVRTSDLSQAMLDHKPEIVHFSGHGQGTPTGHGNRALIAPSKGVGLESDPSPLVHEGLVLEDDQGRAKLVSASALAGLFELFQNEVRCVVLNACYSETQAAAIHQHIDCVVGMNKAIGDRAAIQFATEFYKALATGRSIEFAYHFAQKGLDLDSIPESLTPVLRNRRGTEDPFRITTAPANSNPPVTVPEPQPQPFVQPSSASPSASRKSTKWFVLAGGTLAAVLVGASSFVFFSMPTERYQRDDHQGAFFHTSGNIWQEEFASGEKGNVFKEIARDSKYITIYDASREMTIKIPTNGGQSRLTFPQLKYVDVPFYPLTKK
jgi:CHAT domain